MDSDSERIHKLLKIINDYNSSKPHHPITTNIDLDGLIVQCWMRDLPIDELAYGEPYDEALRYWSKNGIRSFEDGESVIGGRDEHGCDIEYDIHKNNLYISLRYWKEIKSSIINYNFIDEEITHDEFWKRLNCVLKPLGKGEITCKSEFVRITLKCDKLETIYIACETINYFLLTRLTFLPIQIECLWEDHNKGIEILKRIYHNDSALTIQKAWKRYWLKPYYDLDRDYYVSRYMISNKSVLLDC